MPWVNDATFKQFNALTENLIKLHEDYAYKNSKAYIKIANSARKILRRIYTDVDAIKNDKEEMKKQIKGIASTYSIEKRTKRIFTADLIHEVNVNNASPVEVGKILNLASKLMRSLYEFRDLYVYQNIWPIFNEKFELAFTKNKQESEETPSVESSRTSEAKSDKPTTKEELMIEGIKESIQKFETTFFPEEQGTQRDPKVEKAFKGIDFAMKKLNDLFSSNTQDPRSEESKKKAESINVALASCVSVIEIQLTELTKILAAQKSNGKLDESFAKNFMGQYFNLFSQLLEYRGYVLHDIVWKMEEKSIEKGRAIEGHKKEATIQVDQDFDKFKAKVDSLALPLKKEKKEKVSELKTPVSAPATIISTSADKKGKDADMTVTATKQKTGKEEKIKNAQKGKVQKSTPESAPGTLISSPSFGKEKGVAMKSESSSTHKSTFSLFGKQKSTSITSPPTNKNKKEGPSYR